MMHDLTRKPSQIGGRWLRSLFPSICVATSLVATLTSGGLATAAECRFTAESGAMRDVARWEWTSPRLLLPSISMEWECFCGLAPNMGSSRFVMSNVEDQRIATTVDCSSLKTLKAAVPNRVMIPSSSKVNSSTQIMTVSTLAYNGKKQVLKTRTVSVGIRPAVDYTASTFIGPVQEIRGSILSNECGAAQALATTPPIDNARSLFGDHTLGLLNQFESIHQPSDNELHRMNLTTALTLHGRDCVSDCP